MARFTAKFLDGLKPGENSRLVAGGDGLYVRVSPKGKKTWLFLYGFGGKRRWHKLGTYPDTGLATARERLRDAKELLGAGKDPALVKQEAQEAPTIAKLVEEFIDKGLKAKGNRSWKEYERNLQKDVIPAWGDRKARDITKRDVILLLESIVERGARNQSNQVFKIIRRMFNFAVERDILEFSPCLQVKPLAPEVSKERFLSETEIKGFWRRIAECTMTEDTQRVLKLILVTAQRPGEVVGAHSSEIDGDWWTIPAERSKNGKSHRVYLTPLSKELFPKREGFLFPSPRRGKNGEVLKPVENNAVAKALHRSMDTIGLAKFTPHDLRRTAASHMAGLGFGVIVEKVLNHTNRTVTAIYDRYSYDRDKQKALEAWSRKLQALVTDDRQDNVIPMTRN